MKYTGPTNGHMTNTKRDPPAFTLFPSAICATVAVANPNRTYRNQNQKHVLAVQLPAFASRNAVAFLFPFSSAATATAVAIATFAGAATTTSSCAFMALAHDANGMVERVSSVGPAHFN